MERLSEQVQKNIIRLRMKGLSIPEISRELGVAKTTVQRYVKNIIVPEKYRKSLREKQGGARDRAAALRTNLESRAQQEIGKLNSRDTLLLLTGLYWGEGTKRDFALINSDPFLIQTVLCALETLHIPASRISLSLRVHNNISVSDARTYWSTITGIPEERISRIEIIEGKKKGKLPYGMCRIRVASGIRERLYIQSIIAHIGKESSKRVLSL